MHLHMSHTMPTMNVSLTAEMVEFVEAEITGRMDAGSRMKDQGSNARPFIQPCRAHPRTPAANAR